MKIIITIDEDRNCFYIHAEQSYCLTLSSNKERFLDIEKQVGFPARLAIHPKHIRVYTKKENHNKFSNNVMVKNELIEDPISF